MKLGIYDQKALGTFLRKKRIGAGLTQAKVAKALGLASSQFISNIERGLCVTPLKSLKILLNLYGVHPDTVIERLARQYRSYLQKVLLGKSPTSKVNSYIP